MKGVMRTAKDVLLAFLWRATVVVAALIVTGLALAVAGYDPLAFYGSVLVGSVTDLGGTLRWATPMILGGLAMAVAFRGRVWNIGVEGQLYMGAFAATFVGLRLGEWPSLVVVPTALLLSMIMGALWGSIPGFLLARYGANEIVTTLMLNFVAVLFTDWLVLGPFQQIGAARASDATDKIANSAYLARLTLPNAPSSGANVGLIIGIILAFIIYFFMYRTTIGYEIRVMGASPGFAQYGGIRIPRTIVMVMVISGAIAGLMGAIEILGIHRYFPRRFASGLGFDGIVVSLLAGNHSLGVIPAGLFFGILKNGAMNMERTTDVPRAMVQVAQAIMILGMSAHIPFKSLIRRNRGKESV